MDIFQRYRDMFIDERVQQIYPNRPYSMIFNGELLPREFSLVDFLLFTHPEVKQLPEYIRFYNRQIGADSNRPAEYFFDWWWQYCFFNTDPSSCMTLESHYVIPRCYRLISTLYFSDTIPERVRDELNLADPFNLIDLWVECLEKMIASAERRPICSWSYHNDKDLGKDTLELHREYIDQVIKPLEPTYMMLGHRKEEIDYNKNVLKEEIKFWKAGQAHYRKQTKLRKKNAQRAKDLQSKKT